MSELCLEAVSSRQRDRLRIFQFCLHLVKTQKAITQRARLHSAFGIALWVQPNPELDLQTIWGVKSKAWTTFRQIFQFLHRDNIGDGIFSPDDIQHTDLRDWLELPPIEVLKVCFEHAKTQGWKDLVEILSTAHPEVIAGFLGVLAAATAMNLLDDWLRPFCRRWLSINWEWRAWGPWKIEKFTPGKLFGLPIAAKKKALVSSAAKS